MLLGRKLWRELRSQKGQSIAVILVTAIGVLLYVTSAGGYLDLDSSYAHTRAQLALADLHIDVPAISDEEVAAIAASGGVKHAEARVVTSLPFRIGRDKDRVELRVISAPQHLDRVLLLLGRTPRGPDEVLVEKHLAHYHDLEPGDAITLDAPGRQQTLRVSGVAVSAEYLWVTRDETDIFAMPDAFGVGWMDRDGLRTLARDVLEASAGSIEGAATPGLATLAVAASPSAGNQLLIGRAEGTTDAKLTDEVRRRLGEERVLAATPAKDLLGVRVLQLDVDGYRDMAAFFPAFFLAVAVFIVASLLSRLVDAQRPLLATLLALGVSRTRVLAHYLAYSFALAGTGALIGAGLGLLASREMTHQYALELGIPFVVTSLHWELALHGLLFGALTALLAGWAPAFHASRLPPAEGMRPPRPRLSMLARAARRMPLPLWLRLAIRDVIGRPFRSVGAVMGVAAALVLVLSTGAFTDSMTTTFNVLFEDANRYDLRIDLVRPERAEDLQARLKKVAGVSHLEGIVALPVSLSREGAQGASDETHAMLRGLVDDASLLRSIDLDRRVVMPDAGGIVLGRTTARSLGVELGEKVRAELLPHGPAATFHVAGFADAVMGDTASVRLADAQQAFGLKGLVTAAALSVRPGELDRTREEIAAFADAAHVEDLAATRDAMDALMGLGWLLIGIMLIFSVVLAAAILFNTATLNILERRRELATLRALGRSQRELTLSLTLEHAVIALLGFALGLPLSVLAAKAMLARFSSDLFQLPFVLSAGTVAAAGVGVVLVLLLAQWPALRTVSRASLADLVRVREG